MTYNIVIVVAKGIENLVASHVGHCSQGESNLLYQAGHTREISTLHMAPKLAAIALNRTVSIPDIFFTHSAYRYSLS